MPGPGPFLLFPITGGVTVLNIGVLTASFGIVPALLASSGAAPGLAAYPETAPALLGQIKMEP